MDYLIFSQCFKYHSCRLRFVQNTHTLARKENGAITKTCWFAEIIFILILIFIFIAWGKVPQCRKSIVSAFFFLSFCCFCELHFFIVFSCFFFHLLDLDGAHPTNLSMCQCLLLFHFDGNWLEIFSCVPKLKLLTN